MAACVIIGSGTISFGFTDSALLEGVLTTTWTFAGKAIGTASSERNILVIAQPSSVLNVVSAVTVGGVSAAAVSNTTGRFWFASVPSGTTATTVITTSSNQNCVAVGLYSIYGPVNKTPFDLQAAAGTGTTSVNLNVQSGGIAVCYGLTSAVTTPPDQSWSGVTENYDRQGTAAVSKTAHSGASGGVYSSAQTLSITLSQTGGGGTPFKNLTAVSFSPT